MQHYSRWFIVSIGLLCINHSIAISLSEMRQLNQHKNQVAISALDLSRASTQTQPAKKPAKLLPASAIEKDYTSRSGETLRQFGYETFRNHVPMATTNGSVAEDYLLGIGDELIITLQGQDKKSIAARIDREGRVILSGFAPIRAASRAFSEFRDELKARIENSMINTEVFISVGAIRMISVIITGEVNQPGRYQLTGLSNINDALYAANGIRKTGSLRRIQIRRGDRILHFDAYDTLFGNGKIKNPPLQQGDQIIVPTIGNTVAIAGSVKRPGIFELKYKKQRASNLAQILNWAGGPIRTQGNRYLRQTLNKAGQEVYTDLPNKRAAILEGGDILQVRIGGQRQLDSITLSGNIQVPGKRSLKKYPTLSRLLGGEQQAKKILGIQPYLPFAVIRTTDPATQARYFKAINLKSVLNGQHDYHFHDEDELIIFNPADIQFPMSADVQSILAGESKHQERLSQAAELNTGQQLLQQGPSAKQSKGCSSLQALKNTLAGESIQRFANAVRITENTRWLKVQNCPSIYEKHPELLSFMLEYMVILNGEIRQPGIYPVAEKTLLSDLLSFAGGLTRSADHDNIEFNREIYSAPQSRYQIQRQQLTLNGALASIIQPGDTLRFNATISNRGQGGILLVGEFNHPGVYTLARGETLSQVIARAGGLTPQAYPYGAVLTRERLKRQERRNYARTARDLQDASVTLLSRSRDSSAAVMASLVKQLKETPAVGRIVMEADPKMLQLHPELDTLLEPGDTLYMPQRNNIVTVVGEVLNPGTSSFVPGQSTDDYITMAGGLRRYADVDRLFVVLPNGEAQPIRINHWNYNPTQIPPGSTIIVPRDVAPFNLHGFVQDISGIFSNLAISAAAIATINNR